MAALMFVVCAVASVGELAEGLRLSQQWQTVTFDSVNETVIGLIQQGILRTASNVRGPGLLVAILAASHEVALLLKGKDDSWW